MKVISFRSTVIIFFAIVLTGCTSFFQNSKSIEEAKIYTAHNIWIHHPVNMRCVNYKNSIEMIPAGTEITFDKNKKIEIKMFRDLLSPNTYQELWETKSRTFKNQSTIDVINKNASKICIKTVQDRDEYTISFTDKYHPGKTIYDYVETMFTEKNISELLKGLNQKEIDSINNGVIMVGMSKRAVLISYGYPPEIKTPDLTNNIWTYYFNESKTEEVIFDDKGIVIQIR